MNKSLLLVAALALTLVSCAHLRDARAPDPANPRVSVTAGNQVVVNQEPIIVPKGAKDFKITWHLPSGMNFRFQRDGIAIERGVDQFNCRLEEGGLAFSCIDKNTVRGKFKYTITVYADGRRLDPLDPTIVNDL